MKKTLSENRRELWNKGKSARLYPKDWIVIPVRDVLEVIEKQDKEFINDLIENIPYKKTAWAKLMRLEIIKRAGKELVE